MLLLSRIIQDLFQGDITHLLLNTKINGLNMMTQVVMILARILLKLIKLTFWFTESKFKMKIIIT